MRTAGIALTLFAALLFVPSAVQRIRHRRDLQAELRRVTNERDEALGNVDYWRSQYHGGVDAIIDRLRVAVDESPVEDAPLFDRACLAWLDKATEWDAS